MSCKTCGAESSTYTTQDSPCAEPRTEEVKISDGLECRECGQKTRHKQSIGDWLERELCSMGGSLTEIQERWQRHMLIPDSASQKREDFQLIREAFFDLRKRPDAYWRGTSMFLRRHREPEMKLGTKVYRFVAFSKGWSKYETRIEEGEQFTRTDKGDFLIYADYGHSFGEVPIWTARAKSHHGRGFKCFAKEPPLPGWTHFVVCGFAKNGRSAFVEAVAGSREELIAAYGSPENWKSPGVEAPKKAGVAEPPELAALRRITVTPEPIKPKPYICASCAGKGRGSTGPGRCLVCKQEYSDRPIGSDRGRAW